MSNAPTLDRLQQWMLAVITHPDGIAAGIEGDEARQQIPVAADGVEQVVDRSAACSAIERLGVYGNAYFARLLECLQAEYDVLVQAMGAEGFAALAAGYLQRYPSTSYTLGQLGSKLPQYLDDTRPPREDGDAIPDWADFLIDLARLERTYTEVFDGPGDEATPPLDVARLQNLAPEAWGTVRLQMARSLRLLELRFPVHEAYAALRAGGELPAFSPRTVHLAISRKNYIVQRREVSPVQSTLLQRLLDGDPLDEALGATLETHALDADELADSLPTWFQEWTAAGLFTDYALEST